MKGRRGYPGSPGRYGTPGKVCQSVSLSVCQSVNDESVPQFPLLYVP